MIWLSATVIEKVVTPQSHARCLTIPRFLGLAPTIPQTRAHVPSVLHVPFPADSTVQCTLDKILILIKLLHYLTGFFLATETPYFALGSLILGAAIKRQEYGLYLHVKRL